MRSTKEIEQDATCRVLEFFDNYGHCASASVTSPGSGKIYELYCMAETIEWLEDTYSAKVTFVKSKRSKSRAVHFKASPGVIDRSFSYFEISANGKKLELHTNIEIETLGSSKLGHSYSHDRSCYHEIDLVLIDSNVSDKVRPSHDDLLLSVRPTQYSKRKLSNKCSAFVGNCHFMMGQLIADSILNSNIIQLTK